MGAPTASYTPTSDELYARQWTPLLILGALPWALIATVDIFIGQLILSKANLKCAEKSGIKDFLGLSIVFSYLFLIPWAWIWMGFTWEFKVRGRIVRLLRPYSSLMSVGTIWLLVFLATLGVFGWGSAEVGAGVYLGCASEAPTMYMFALLLVIAYWIAAFCSIWFVVKSACGGRIKKNAKAAVARMTDTGPTPEDLVKKAFDSHDHDKAGMIEEIDLATLLADINIVMGEDEVDALFEKIGKDGHIKRARFVTWWNVHGKKLTSKSDAAPSDDEDDDDDDDV